MYAVYVIPPIPGTPPRPRRAHRIIDDVDDDERDVAPLQHPPLDGDDLPPAEKKQTPPAWEGELIFTHEEDGTLDEFDAPPVHQQRTMPGRT